MLGQVTREFIATLSLQAQLELAAEAVTLAAATHKIAARRADRGAAPQADALRASAALARLRIERSRLQVEYESRKVALATLWGETRPEFEDLQGDLFHFGPADNFKDLYQRASNSPAIQIYASRQRLRQADIELSRSRAMSDIRWQVGVRHFGETDDTALVAGISVPLFAERRSRGEVEAALAARDAVHYRREDTLLRLHARLFEAYRLRQQSIDTVEQIRTRVLPSLQEALAQTREAYEGGRYSYTEWTSAQREVLSARRALVDAATTALLNQTLIEQLTAQPLTTARNTPRPNRKIQE